MHSHILRRCPQHNHTHKPSHKSTKRTLTRQPTHHPQKRSDKLHHISSPRYLHSAPIKTIISKSKGRNSSPIQSSPSIAPSQCNTSNSISLSISPLRRSHFPHTSPSRPITQYLRHRIALSQLSTKEPLGTHYQPAIALHLGRDNIIAAVAQSFNQVELVPTPIGTFQTPSVGYVESTHPMVVFPGYQPAPNTDSSSSSSSSSKFTSYHHLRELLGRTQEDCQTQPTLQRIVSNTNYSIDRRSGAIMTTGNHLTIQDIYSEVINSVLRRVQSQLGQLSLPQVVCTVPDIYTAQQRLALVTMLQRQCDIISPKLITESVAACLAYGLGKYNNSRIVVVHPTDGGITATLLQCNLGSFYELGVKHIDFDTFSNDNENKAHSTSSSDSTQPTINNPSPRYDSNSTPWMPSPSTLNKFDEISTDSFADMHSFLSPAQTAAVAVAAAANSSSSSQSSSKSSYSPPDERILRYIQHELWFTRKIDLFRHPTILLGCIANLPALYDSLITKGVATIRLNVSSAASPSASSTPLASLSLALPAIPFHDISITQEQYYSIIRPAISPHLLSVLSSLLSHTTFSPQDINHVVLAGESPHASLFLDDLHAFFGVTPANWAQSSEPESFSSLLSSAAQNAADISLGTVSISPFDDERRPPSSSYFPSRPPIFPQFSCAIGAAKHAALLCGHIQPTQTWDTLPMSIGMRVHIPQSFSVKSPDSFLPNIEKTLPLIPAGALLPFTQLLTVSTMKPRQSSIQIDLLHGERVLAADNAFIGTLHLDDLPLHAAGVETVKVGVTADQYGHVSIFMQSLTNPSLISSAAFTLPQYTPRQEALLLPPPSSLFSTAVYGAATLTTFVINSLLPKSQQLSLPARKRTLPNRSLVSQSIARVMQQSIDFIRMKPSDMSQKITRNDLISARIVLDPLRTMTLAGNNRITDVLELIDPKYTTGLIDNRDLAILWQYLEAEDAPKSAKHRRIDAAKNDPNDVHLSNWYNTQTKLKRRQARANPDNVRSKSSNDLSRAFDDDIEDNNDELNVLLRELRNRGLSPLTIDDPSLPLSSHDSNTNEILRSTELPGGHQERLRAKMHRRCIALINAASVFVKHNNMWFDEDELAAIQQRIDVANTMLNEPQPKYAELAAVHLGREIKRLSAIFIQRRERLHEWRVKSREEQAEQREKRRSDFFVERIERRQKRAEARERARSESAHHGIEFNEADWNDTDEETEKIQTQEFLQKEASHESTFNDAYYYDTDDEAYEQNSAIPREIFTPANGWESPVLRIVKKSTNHPNPLLARLDRRRERDDVVDTLEATNENIVRAQWRAQRILSANGIHLNSALSVTSPELFLPADVNPNPVFRSQENVLALEREKQRIARAKENEAEYREFYGKWADPRPYFETLSIEELEKRLEDDPLDQDARLELDDRLVEREKGQAIENAQARIKEQLEKDKKENVIATGVGWRSVPRWIPSRFDAVSSPSDIHGEYFDSLARQIRSAVFMKSGSTFAERGADKSTTGSSPSTSDGGAPSRYTAPPGSGGGSSSGDSPVGFQRQLRRLFGSDYTTIMEEGKSAHTARLNLQQSKDEWGIVLTDLLNSTNLSFERSSLSRKATALREAAEQEAEETAELTQEQREEYKQRRKEQLSMPETGFANVTPEMIDVGFAKPAVDPNDDEEDSEDEIPFGSLYRKNITTEEIVYAMNPNLRSLQDVFRQRLARRRAVWKKQNQEVMDSLGYQDLGKRDGIHDEELQQRWHELQQLNTRSIKEEDNDDEYEEQLEKQAQDAADNGKPTKSSARPPPRSQEDTINERMGRRQTLDNEKENDQVLQQEKLQQAHDYVAELEASMSQSEYKQMMKKANNPYSKPHYQSKQSKEKNGPREPPPSSLSPEEYLYNQHLRGEQAMWEYLQDDSAPRPPHDA